VPKSATLLHELFRAIFGDELFAEMMNTVRHPIPLPKYLCTVHMWLTNSGTLADGIAQCLKLGGEDAPKARKNIENFVFFIAYMYHLYGEEDGDEPWSIKKHWDFIPEEVKGDDGKKKLEYGAIKIESDQMEVDG